MTFENKTKHFILLSRGLLIRYPSVLRLGHLRIFRRVVAGAMINHIHTIFAAYEEGLLPSNVVTLQQSSGATFREHGDGETLHQHGNVFVLADLINRVDHQRNEKVDEQEGCAEDEDDVEQVEEHRIAQTKVGKVDHVEDDGE